MQAVKAIYRQGRVELLAPLLGVTDADLFVIVLDKPAPDGDGNSVPFNAPPEADSEQAFRALGLRSFFDANEDSNVDWEDLFDVKPR